jgi:hypothetical protein
LLGCSPKSGLLLVVVVLNVLVFLLVDNNHDACADGALVEEYCWTPKPLEEVVLVVADIELLLMGDWRDDWNGVVVIFVAFDDIGVSGINGLNSILLDMSLKRTTLGRGAVVHRFFRSWNEVKSVFVVLCSAMTEYNNDNCQR